MYFQRVDVFTSSLQILRVGNTGNERHPSHDFIIHDALYTSPRVY